MKARASTARRPAQGKAPPPFVVSRTCGRCGKVHNGSALPPGWAERPPHGLVCDDCDETLSLAAQVGAPGIAA